MNTPVNHSARATKLADLLIGASDGSLGTEGREALRTVLRIAFEVQGVLDAGGFGTRDWDWTRDTLFSGVDSVWSLSHTLRTVLAGCVEQTEHAELRESLRPVPNAFPGSIEDAQRELASALKTVHDDAAPFAMRVRELLVICRLQMLLIGAGIW